MLRERGAQPQSKDPYLHAPPQASQGISIGRAVLGFDVSNRNRAKITAVPLRRIIRKGAIAITLSAVVFAFMQLLVSDVHCFDCGARVGFPFP